MRVIRSAGHGWLGLCLLAAARLSRAAEPAALHQQRALSVDGASRAAWAALRACRARDYSVPVAVVDRGGNPQALLRDRLAGAHTPQGALRKAGTAASFRQSTAELAGLLEDKRIPAIDDIRELLEFGE